MTDPKEGDMDRSRLTYYALRAMPPDWVAHEPLAFEGNQPEEFIARVSGDRSSGLPSEVRIGRYFEIEGYGDSPEAAIKDLTSRLNDFVR